MKRGCTNLSFRAPTLCISLIIFDFGERRYEFYQFGVPTLTELFFWEICLSVAFGSGTPIF